METKLIRYKTVTDFLQAANGKSVLKDENRSSRTGGFAFTGTKNFQEALDLAKKGWPEGTKRARSFSMKIKKALDATGYKKEWRSEVYGGGTLQVTAYIEGRPDCYRHLKKKTSQKFLRIVFSGGASGTVGKDTLIIRGAMAALLCETLEAEGYRVQVDLAFCTEDELKLETTVTLKNYSESIDLDRLVFFTAHPSSLRRLSFSQRECLPKEIRELIGIPGDYGIPSNPDDRGDIWFPSARSNDPAWQTPESAAAFVRRMLAEKGIEI